MTYECPVVGYVVLNYDIDAADLLHECCKDGNTFDAMFPKNKGFNVQDFVQTQITAVALMVELPPGSEVTFLSRHTKCIKIY